MRITQFQKKQVYCEALKEFSGDNNVDGVMLDLVDPGGLIITAVAVLAFIPTTLVVYEEELKLSMKLFSRPEHTSNQE